MDNESGKLTGFCPLFDHDHAFAPYETVISQTTEESVSLYEAAARAQRELRMDLSALEEMRKPLLLSEEQWMRVMERADRLRKGIRLS